jgi:hypothetical protein
MTIEWYWVAVVALAAAYVAAMFVIFAPPRKKVAPPAPEPDPDFAFLPSGFAVRKLPVTVETRTDGADNIDITIGSGEQRRTYYSRRYEPS